MKQCTVMDTCGSETPLLDLHCQQMFKSLTETEKLTLTLKFLASWTQSKLCTNLGWVQLSYQKLNNCCTVLINECFAPCTDSL